MFLYFNPYIFGTTGPGPVVYPASGGTITQVGSYTIHTFLSSGTFTVLSSALACDILVVAGGGGGGGYVGGGGGGGGVQYFVNQNLAANAYTVTVGTGGAGATSGSTWPANGGNSQFGTLTPSVGGGAGGSSNAGSPPQGTYPAGTAGGSGGGGVNSGAGGAGTPGQGNTGSGSGFGGGGGAGAASTTINGGSGIANSITGTLMYYAGGGGAYGGTIGAAGGTGGVGGGGASISGGGVAGTANTGGGGGGTTSNTGGANGGSGIVIVRYLTVAVPMYLMDYVSAIANATGLYACKRLLTSYLGPVMRLTDPATVLLLHCDNPSTNSTTVGGYIDASSYNNSITASGVTYSSGVYKYGTSSLAFTTTSYMTTPSSTIFALGNKSFTLEFFIYFTAAPGTGSANTTIITNSINNNTNGDFGLWFNGSQNLYFSYNTGSNTDTLLTAWNSSWLNTWSHFALVRNGTYLQLFVNGVSLFIGSAISTTSIGTSPDTLRFGANTTGWTVNNISFTGYLDEIRVSIGVARYKGNFPITGNDTITTSGGYTIHTFTGAGTLTVSGGSATCDILVVGGGGGASLGTSGGGGGGGYTYMTSQTLTSGSWNVTVGAGGAGSSAQGQKGGTSSFSGIYGAIADGGGYGGGAGGSGGSGGGASPLNNGGLASGIGTGNAGGNAQNTGGGYAGSGGGGAGAAGGSTPNNTTGGAGGTGLQNSITGTAVYYAGGGGGGTNSGTAGAGTAATGGGGAGTVGNGNGINGTPNTGGGGGGTGYISPTSGAGGSGGSGVVILRYLTASTTITTSFVPITIGTFGGATTSSVDASYANTVLLLHADGNNGVSASSSAYYDSSPLNALMSVSGTPTFSSTQKKFGVSSLSFNGSSYLQTPTNANYTFGSKDFTIEFWMYIVTKPGSNTGIIGNNIINTNSGAWGIYTDGTNIYSQWAGNTLVFGNFPYLSSYTGNWNHYAYVRNGATTTVYVNGISVVSLSNFGTSSIDSGTGSNTITVGSWPPTLGGINAYFDDIRVTIGTTRYLANFSVPTSAFPDLPTGPVATDLYSDPNGNLNTKVDGSGTTYTSWASTNSIIFAPVLTWYDQSTRANHARAFPGSWPVYDPYNNLLDFSTLAGSYGGNASGNNYMSLPDGTVPSGVSPTFTITARHGTRDTTQNNTIIFGGIPGNNTISMSMAPSSSTPANSYFMNTWGTNPITAANTVEVGNVVTFAYNGSSVTQYIKGVSVNTAAVSLSVSSLNNAIGYVPAQSQYINGQINFISVFNSVLSTLDQTIVESQWNYFDPYYYNTVLLLRGDSQISSTTTTTTIIDSSFYNATMTAVNGASIASGTYPNGNKTFGNALYFPGFIGQNQMNGYQITTPACSGLYDFSGNNFTIECWVYNTNGNTANWFGIMGNYQNNSSPPVSGCWRVYAQNTNLNCDFAVGTTNYNVYSTSFNKNTWYHIAIVRNLSTLTLYLNGVNVSSTTMVGNMNIANNTINIGWGGSWDGSWVGYIDDVRITNGVARYTTNFNVPLGPSSAIEAKLPIATGGTVSGPVTIDGSSYMIHQFLQTGASTFELNQTAVCDILVVAGGGGAGNGGSGGGGGGGGGVRYASRITLQPGTYNVTVGSGGLGGGGSSGVPTQGGNSSFGSLIDSTGGGYSAYQNSGGTYIAAGSGGSGGGGISGNTAGGQPIYGQGYLGGTYASGSTGGGGGGAGGAGGGSGNSLGTNGNDGGPGAASSITGITLYYGGGGGGGNNTTTGLGGIGGGGGSSRTTNGGNGIANTGGGGQGQGANGTSGNGGSGIVIVRYPVVTPIATITNPSVEFTTTPSSGWTGGLMSNASGTTCIGWTFTGTAGAATILNPSLTPATYGSVGAKDGVNVIYISANASTAVGTIANLVIGSVYIVRLWVLSPPIAGSNGGNAFTVTVNTSSATTTIYSSTAITNTTSWTQITCQSFTATSTTHTLTLAGNIASKSVMIDALTIAISTNPMIINPSLEATTPIAPTSWQVSYNARIPPGTACAGWTLYGTGASIVNNNIQSTNWGPATSDGNAVVILSVFAFSAPWPTPTAYGTIENLSIGVSYVVYMSITNRNVSQTGGTFTAFVNTTPSQTTIYSPTSITWQSWQYTACTSFTATSTSHTLALQATATTPLDSSICIDSITVAIPRSTPASPTLLGYWDFTNAANYNGSSVTDLSTNGVNLTWMGGGTPSYTTTGAMCANLTDNISYLQSNTEAPWGGSVLTSGFTFECLVKVTSLDTSTSFPSLMGYGGANSLPYFNIVTGNGGGWYWQAGTTNSAWNMYGPSPINSQPSTTAWSHLVFVCKPTGNQSIIYVNGVAISLLGGGGTNIVVGPDKLFYLGTCAVNGSTGLAPTRTGKIYLAMARMYSGILPATGTVSVATNYNQYKNMSGNPYAI